VRATITSAISAEFIQMAEFASSDSSLMQVARGIGAMEEISSGCGVDAELDS
jgi:hypothetical protein